MTEHVSWETVLREMPADVANEVKRQMEVIMRGAVEIIPVEELLLKLRWHVETGKPLKVKLGLDPSAPDIHLGHVVVLEKLRQFQELGHIVQLVIGDFTGMIGDPTGKSETRKQLTVEQVQQNAKTYQTQIFKVLDTEKTEIHFNSTWLATLNFSEVVRLASTITVARMLEREDFRKRYAENTPISVHEFFYPLMQAYDSVALQTDVELGGTDQTFNLLMGRTLQKEFALEPQIVLTMPLIEGLDGVQKMSKSLGNYIGIMNAPSEIYGKTMSIPDHLMSKYYLLLSGLSLADVHLLEAQLEDGTLHPRDAKMRLAYLLTKRFHDDTAATTAQEEFVRVFQQHSMPIDIPVFAVDNKPRPLYELVTASGMAPSNSEARRLIMGGGVKINGEAQTDRDYVIEPQTDMIVQVGKRKFVRLDVGQS